MVVCDIAEDIPTVPYHLSSQADLDETVAQIEALDRRAIGLVADMRSTDQVNQVVTTAISEFGRIDILVANQGIISHAPVDGTTDEVWDNIIATNLTGIFKLTRAVLPHMRERGYGRIVATASSIARSGRANVAAYAASKWGVLGFVKSCAQDVAGTGITVNALCPSIMNTGMIFNPATFKLFCPEIGHPTQADFEGRVKDMFAPAIPGRGRLPHAALHRRRRAWRHQRAGPRPGLRGHDPDAHLSSVDRAPLSGRSPASSVSS